MKRTASFAWLAMLSFSSFSGGAAAREVPVDMFQAAFLPQSITLSEGDSVRWIWRRGSHSVTSGMPGGAAGTPSEPGALFDAVVDEGQPEFAFTFNEYREGGYTYFCREHPDQLGLVEIASGQVTVRVAVVDNVFSPEEVFISAGDSILWEHEPMEDYHTITSGFSSRPEDNPGALFDEESTDQFPIFTFQFEAAGDYPYFCIPHEEMGMKGMIHVQEAFVRADATGEGMVDISDPIAILNHLFLGGEIRCCTDALDANDDGEVDIGDPVFALIFLFSGGARIPQPFPRAGGDRTEDEILCCYQRGT